MRILDLSCLSLLHLGAPSTLYEQLSSWCRAIDMFAELKSIQGGISLTRKRRRRLDAVVFLAETMHKYSYGILEAIRTGLDNSVAEGLNNKVKTVVKRSY